MTNIFKTKDFSNEELETLIPKFKQITFSKNDYLLNEGEKENHYWFIEMALCLRTLWTQKAMTLLQTFMLLASMDAYCGYP